MPLPSPFRRPLTAVFLAIASLLVFKFSPIATATPYFPNSHLLVGIAAAVGGVVLSGWTLLRATAASRRLAIAGLVLNVCALLLWGRYILWFVRLAQRQV